MSIPNSIWGSRGTVKRQEMENDAENAQSSCRVSPEWSHFWLWHYLDEFLPFALKGMSIPLPQSQAFIIVLKWKECCVLCPWTNSLGLMMVLILYQLRTHYPLLPFFSHGYYETSFKDRGYCATYVISACLKKRDKCVTNPIYFAIVENDWQFCSLESFFSFQNAHWVACGESTIQTSVSLRQMQPLAVMAQQSMSSLSLLLQLQE